MRSPRLLPPFDRRLPAVALILLAAVAVIYGQTYHHGFIGFDDNDYLGANPEVTGGFSWHGFVWAFGFHAANWHPLTWLSHMLDCQLFGLWAGGHHLMSAGFHTANAVLLAAVLMALTGAFWRSAAVAAIFALHPLRVESVAWAAERKDVLSALFWILTVGAYVRYVRRPGCGRYLAVLGLFALGLSAKPMLVTGPFVFLLLDWWPLGRLCPSRPGDATQTVAAGYRTGWALLWEKIPFLLLSLTLCLITLLAQTQNIRPYVVASWEMRIANAASSYLLYLWTFVRPTGLAPLYPYPREMRWEIVVPAAATLIIVGIVVVLLRRRYPYLLMGWLWYLGMLIPVIGLVQVGAQSRSDRYTYLSLTGVTLALVWLVGEMWPRRKWVRMALVAAFGLALATLTWKAQTYARVWRDNIVLFEHAIRVTEDNAIMLNNLGTALRQAGRYRDAVRVLEEALQIEPENGNVHYNLGNALFHLERYPEALAAFSRALLFFERDRAKPGFRADTYYSLGNTYLRLARLGEAEWAFRTLLRGHPNYPGGRIGLAEALLRQNKPR